MGFFVLWDIHPLCPLPANGIIWGPGRASLRGWNSVGFQDTPGGPMFIQHDKVEPAIQKTEPKHKSK